MTFVLSPPARSASTLAQLHHDLLEFGYLFVVAGGEERIDIDVLFGRDGGIAQDDTGGIARCRARSITRSDIRAVRFRKGLAQRLRETAFGPSVDKFVALFLLGASGIGIGDANVPERIFREDHAEALANNSLDSLSRFENFDVQFFARSKRGILHHAVEDDSRDLRGVSG